MKFRVYLAMLVILFAGFQIFQSERDQAAHTDVVQIATSTASRTSKPIISTDVSAEPLGMQSLTDDFSRDPERGAQIIKDAYREFLNDLRSFYATRTNLNDAQQKKLDALEQKNSLAGSPLPLEAGVEVVTEKIFAGRAYKTYMAQIKAEIGGDNFSRLQYFLDEWPQKWRPANPTWPTSSAAASSCRLAEITAFA